MMVVPAPKRAVFLFEIEFSGARFFPSRAASRFWFANILNIITQIRRMRLCGFCLFSLLISF